MGFFDDITGNLVKTKRNEYIENILVPYCSNESFAVTCGNVEQRAMIFYRYLCDAVANKIPVVILYKGNGIDSVLNSINGLVNVHPGSLVYDPFYGKTILEIWLLLDSILSNVSTGIEENANKRLAFERYARIISPNDSRDITLDMFKWVLELDEFGLNYYIDSLSYMNIAQKSQTKKLFEPYFSARQNGVAAMRDKLRDSFSVLESVVEGRLWKNDKTNYKNNIRESVRNGGIIAIKIDDSKPALLDFIGKEIEGVTAGKFLLACCDLDSKKGTKIADVIANHNGVNGYPLFVSSADIAGHFTSEDQRYWAELAPRTLLVLNCGNAISAEPYKTYVGKHLEEMVARQEARNRAPFAIFPGHTDAVVRSQQMFDRLLHNKFCVANGCVFCNNNYIVQSDNLKF